MFDSYVHLLLNLKCCFLCSGSSCCFQDGDDLFDLTRELWPMVFLQCYTSAGASGVERALDYSRIFTDGCAPRELQSKENSNNIDVRMNFLYQKMVEA